MTAPVVPPPPRTDRTGCWPYLLGALIGLVIFGGVVSCFIRAGQRLVDAPPAATAPRR